MDELLQKGLSSVEQERVELLQMLERFEVQIREFQKDYQEIYTRRTNDLTARRRDGEVRRQRTEQEHQRAVNALQTGKKREISAQQDNLRQARTRCQNQVQKLDTEFREWESQEQDRLLHWEREDQSCRERDQKILDTLRQIRTETSLLVGEKLYHRAVGHVQGRPCKDQHHAQRWLAQTTITHCRQLQRDIQIIQESLVRRIVQQGRQGTLCHDIEQMVQDAEGAADWLKKERERQAKGRRADYQNQRKEKNQSCQSKKQALQANLHQEEQRLQSQIQTLASSYDGKLQALEQTYQKDFAQLLDRQRQELGQAEKDWGRQLHQRAGQFAVRMEEQFPAQRMNALLREIWDYPRTWRTDTLPQGCAQRDAVVGEMFLPVAWWYQGASGALVQALMEQRYSGLFPAAQGKEERQLQIGYVRLPCKLSLENGESLLLMGPDRLRDPLEQYAQAIGLRLLWAIPARQARMLLADPAAIGSFAKLAMLDPAQQNADGVSVVRGILDGDHVCSDPTELQQRIRDHQLRYNDLAGQMAGSSSLRAFNASHPMNPRSHQLTLIQKFPTGLKEDSLQFLRMMSSDCGRLGYSAILSGTESTFAQTPEKLRDEVRQIMEQCIDLQMVSERQFRVTGSPNRREVGATVFFYPMPGQKELTAMQHTLRQETEQASSNMIYFEQAQDICPPREQWFQNTASDGIVVPVGYLDGGTPFRMIFDDARVHAIINGETSSGKTNLLHVLITNTLLRYPPEEVELYLIDFKHGTEFRKYTRYNLPNIRAISVCNEPEFALEVLRGLKKEIERRSALFGDQITGLKSYNQHSGKKLCRILLVLDELFQLEEEAKSSAGGTGIRDEIMKLLQEFAIQARCYGIHMVIAGQNLTTIREIHTIKQSCKTCIALRSSPEQVKLLMGADAVDRMRRINDLDRGASVVQVGQQGVQVEHTAFLEPDRQHLRLLRELDQYYCAKGQYTRARVLVTDVSVDRNNLFRRYLEEKDLTQVQPDSLYLGELYSMQPPKGLALHGENLWLAGGWSAESSRAGNSAMFFALFSLLLQQRKMGGNIHICYCDATANQFESDDRAGELGQVLRQQITYTAGEGLEQLLQNIWKELQARKSGSKSHNERVYLLLQRIEESSAQNIQLYQMLREILQYGPSLGIQTVVWTRDVQRAAAWQLASASFGEKLALEMDGSFYAKILGMKPRVEPRQAQACMQNGERLRIYDLPGKDWTEQVMKMLLARA